MENSFRIAVEGLLKLGLLRNGTPEELYMSGAWRAFFPHGLGRKYFSFPSSIIV